MPAPAQNDWSDLIDIHQRLDSTIMFTLIRFVYAVLSSHFSDGEAGLICVIAILLAGTSMRWHLHPGTVLLAQVVFSLASALFSQAVINIATGNSRLMKQNVQSASRLLFDFVVVTSLLLGAAVLPDQFRQLPYINRAITLLLYMYTDATEYMLEQLDIGITATFLCVLLYVVLVRFHSTLEQHATAQYLVKALNMVSINVVLASAGGVKNDLTNVQTQAVLIVIILFIIDALHRVTGALQEGRDFAVWKGSSKLFDIYHAADIDTTATLSFAFLVVVLKHVWDSRNSTAVEVVMLVTINVVLDNLGQYTAFAYNMDKVLTLFMYVIVIHSVSNVIAATRERAKQTR